MSELPSSLSWDAQASERYNAFKHVTRELGSVTRETYAPIREFVSQSLYRIRELCGLTEEQIAAQQPTVVLGKLSAKLAWDSLSDKVSSWTIRGSAAIHGVDILLSRLIDDEDIGMRTDKKLLEDKLNREQISGKGKKIVGESEEYLFHTKIPGIILSIVFSSSNSNERTFQLVPEPSVTSAQV